MSVPTPENIVKATLPRTNSWMDRLRVADAAGLEALLAFATELRAHQLQQAANDKGNYILWVKNGKVMGLRKNTGEYRPIDPCYGWPCWACSSSPFWSTISATNSALMRWARRLPGMQPVIEKALVNPKQATICAWLTKEHNAGSQALRRALRGL
ncbi:hypothetical protein [Armatimonas sp.]|uniref:hypothetical protein n=1 Tax=Armatimonas sp. TaxID=1872638 RepID=UPI003751D5BF